MTSSDKSFYKAYIQGYFAGYREARTDIEKGINRLDIESDLLSHPIKAMGLRVQTHNSLTRAGFQYIRDITGLSDSRIIAIRGLGTKGCAEIARWLDENGINNTAWHLFL